MEAPWSNSSRPAGDADTGAYRAMQAATLGCAWVYTAAWTFSFWPAQPA